MEKVDSQWPKQNTWYGQPKSGQTEGAEEFWYFPVRLNNFFVISITMLIWSITSLLISTVTPEYIRFANDYTQSYHKASSIGQFIIIGN